MAIATAVATNDSEECELCGKPSEWPFRTPKNHIVCLSCAGKASDLVLNGLVPLRKMFNV